MILSKSQSVNFNKITVTRRGPTHRGTK